MSYKFIKLGNLIEAVDERNSQLNVKTLRGISTTKKLIPSVAKTAEAELISYKIVKKGHFVYVSDTSRRGEKIALALNTEKDCVVSSIYTVFRITDESKLLPSFLNIYFNRTEFDRYARFHSWGSARETFDWSDMCDIDIPLPDIDTQRRYVEMYEGLKQNQASFQGSIEKLRFVCDSYMDALANSSERKKLGDYITEVDKRNTDLKNTNLLGISVNKRFIKSKSNTETLSLANYKIVERGQFAYVAVTSRNGDKISVAMLDNEAGLISSTYISFEVKDKTLLLPEFLYLWFQREEFDRYARFHSWGSARETFDWNDMRDVLLPIPSIEQQVAIVDMYKALKTRRRLADTLQSYVSPICPILIKGVMDEISK